MAEINLLDRYPQSSRPIEERGQLVTDEQRAIARQFGQEYFDGDRLTGYGGYHYHPRFWAETVKWFRDHYQLAPDASILDVGCAKGFMLYEFVKLMPDLNISGADISGYAYDLALPVIRPHIELDSAGDLGYQGDQFDLVISINTIHNLPLIDCKQALREIERVQRANGHSFITVDAWRTEEERERLTKWNLTALTMMHVDDWKQLFEDVGYTGDFYWFIP